MASPIPEHLPRKAIPQDVSSQILAKIGEVTNKTLSANLARSWLQELDETIWRTKSSIHERIHKDFAAFEQQLESSKSVQTRLQSLTGSVENLHETISHPTNGLVPNLLNSLKAHSTLAQDSADATTLSDSLSFLLERNTELTSLHSLVERGRLSDAASACNSLLAALADASDALHKTAILADMKRSTAATKARVEEQLGYAYSDSIFVSSTELRIHPNMKIRSTESVLDLRDVLSSISELALKDHLITFRRDLTTLFIDEIIRKPCTLVRSSTSLKSTVDSDSLEHPEQRLKNLASVLEFLSEHLFPFLPPPQSHVLPSSLCKPITTSLLNNLIIPSLPSSFDRLPEFLEFTRQAVAFEEQYIIGLLDKEASDTPIRSWMEGVGGHYERQRRTQILETCRSLFLEPEDPGDIFTVEVDAPIRQREPDVIPIQDEEVNGDDGWGLNDAGNSSPSEDNGWGFDSDTELPSIISEAAVLAAPDQLKASDSEPDDAWGWSDDVEATTDDSAENLDDSWDDDPWGNSTSEEPTNSQPMISITAPVPEPAPPLSSPKAATRLEKLASRGKQKQVNCGSQHSPVIPSPLSPLAQPPPSPLVVPNANSMASSAKTRPPDLAPRHIPKESYIVSNRMKEIIHLADNALVEGLEFRASNITPNKDSYSQPGTALLKAAISVIELYMALAPVTLVDQLKSLRGPLLYSNNTHFLSQELVKLEGKSPLLTQSIGECKHHLQILSESWLEDTISKHVQSLGNTLSEGAKGFTFTGDQDRYDECEGAIMQVVQDVKRVAQAWKGLIVKSKYYMALGTMVESALLHILDAITALPDIPELESHRLSELCRILDSLQGVFVEPPNQDSFILAYVPSWLKFSYLSEILEGSMVDITYLLEAGSLVDFQPEELVRLVEALFADTALRTTLINKIKGEHIQ